MAGYLIVEYIMTAAPDTAEALGIGCAPKGMMKGCVAVPFDSPASATWPSGATKEGRSEFPALSAERLVTSPPTGLCHTPVSSRLN